MTVHACQPGRATPFECDGEGSSCALYVSQPAGDNGGWVFELQARYPGGGLFTAKRIVLTSPLRARARVVAAATLPGIRLWQAVAYPPASTTGIEAALLASDIPFVDFQTDGQPGSKGWGYAAASGAAVVTVPVGAKLLEVSADGGAAPSSVTFTVARDAVSTEVLPTIPIAANEKWHFPDASLKGLFGTCSIAFVGTARYSVVWVE